MAEILMSIHGKWADLIFSGEKTVFLYNTDTKSVTGKMTVSDIRELEQITDNLAEYACLSVEEIQEYKGDGTLYGWFIEEAEIFDESLRLKDFDAKRAPQSWQYIRR